MKPSRFALALGLVTFLTAFNARPAWAEPKPIYALALTSREATNYPLDPKMAEYFAAENIHIVSRPLSQPLSQDILRQFHLVILTTFSGLRAPWFALGDSLADYYTLRQSVNELRTYVESGGGLFFIPEFGWAGTEAAETMGELLDPWGIGVVAASPYDPAHAWQTYGWTENISRSPVTRGMSHGLVAVLVLAVNAALIGWAVLAALGLGWIMVLAAAACVAAYASPEGAAGSWPAMTARNASP